MAGILGRYIAVKTLQSTTYCFNNIIKQLQSKTSSSRCIHHRQWIPATPFYQCYTQADKRHLSTRNTKHYKIIHINNRSCNTILTRYVITDSMKYSNCNSDKTEKDIDQYSDGNVDNIVKVESRNIEKSDKCIDQNHSDHSDGNVDNIVKVESSNIEKSDKCIDQNHSDHSDGNVDNIVKDESSKCNSEKSDNYDDPYNSSQIDDNLDDIANVSEDSDELNTSVVLQNYFNQTVNRTHKKASRKDIKSSRKDIKSNKNISQSERFLKTIEASLKDIKSNKKSSSNKESSSNKKISPSERYRIYLENIDIQRLQLKPAPPVAGDSLTAFVNNSETLTNLVNIGVDLSKLEADKSLANLLLRMDFETAMKPYLTFLFDVGVESSNIGAVIDKNPAIFKETLDDLHVRINYLESKGFSVENITRIVTMAPKLLSLTTVKIDQQLGFIQKEFRLTGKEVRKVLTSYPRIILCGKSVMSENRIVFLEFLGFTEWELKNLLLTLPKVVLGGKNALIQRFDYLHNTMGLSHAEILEWPHILKSRLHITKQRYEFLKLIGRDQFNPKKPNYVTMKDLVTRSDEEFCESVAKAPVEQYNAFLKTI